MGREFKVQLWGLVWFSLLFVGCSDPPNSAPIVTDVIINRQTICVNDTVQISVIASDKDNDPITYYWSASRGYVPSGSRPAVITYTAPSIGGSDTIFITVFDGFVSVRIQQAIAILDGGCIASGNPVTLQPIVEEPVDGLSAEVVADVVVEADPTAVVSVSMTTTPTNDLVTPTTQPQVVVPTNTPTRVLATSTTVASSPPTSATSAAPKSSNPSGVGSGGSVLPITFEAFGTWGRGDEDNGSFTQSSEQRQEGSYSGRLEYDFSTPDNDYVVFLQDNAINGEPDRLEAWVYGDGSNHYFNIWIKDNQNQVWQVPLGRVSHTGWQQMSGKIDTEQAWPWGHISGPKNETVEYPILFYALVFDDWNNSDTGSGTIYIDNITAGRSASGANETIVQSSDELAAEPQQTLLQEPPTGSVGSILYTTGGKIMSTDPSWNSPTMVGTAVSSTCSSTPSTGDQSFNVFRPKTCGTQTVGKCLSPNQQYEILIDPSGGKVTLMVSPTGQEAWQLVYADAAINTITDLHWSPNSDSFIFRIDRTVYRGNLSGGYSQIVYPAQNATYSPNGQFVAYLSTLSYEIELVNADGSAPRKLTNTGATSKECPVWLQ